MLPALLLLGLGFAALDWIGPFRDSAICLVHLPSAAKWKCQDRSEFESPAVFAGFVGRCVSWIAFCSCSINEILNLINSTEGFDDFLGVFWSKGVVRFDTGIDRVRFAWHATRTACSLRVPSGTPVVSLCLLPWIVDRRWFFCRGTRWER
jgi:hypothetical protein